MDEKELFERFEDNPAIKGRESKFICSEVKVSLVLASWQESLFSYEWLDEAGKIKPVAEMAEKNANKRKEAEETIADKKVKLERPILGIGIMDNIEIGSGKDLFLTLAAHGVEHIPVHIPQSHESEFRIFLR